MGNFLANLNPYAVRKAEPETEEALPPMVRANPFFNFSYAYMEISLSDGKTHVQAKEIRFENGKLITERCEGTLDHEIFRNMLAEAHNHFLAQLDFWMKPFLPFLPRRRIGRGNDE